MSLGWVRLSLGGCQTLSKAFEIKIVYISTTMPFLYFYNTSFHPTHWGRASCEDAGKFRVASGHLKPGYFGSYLPFETYIYMYIFRNMFLNCLNVCLNFSSLYIYIYVIIYAHVRLLRARLLPILDCLRMTSLSSWKPLWLRSLILWYSTSSQVMEKRMWSK